MAFGMLYLKEDNWRVMYAGGIGGDRFQYQATAPINKWIPYITDYDFFYTDVKRKIYPHLYLGLSYIYTNVKTSTEYEPNPPATKLHGTGIELSYDKRSNVSYPRSGYLIEAYYLTYPKAFGNKYVSNQIIIDYNHYFSTRNKKDVFATRFYSGVGLGQVDFNQQFIFGEVDLRGYSQGQYRGNFTTAIQAEYRWNFHKKFGLVGFGGVGTVFGSDNVDKNGVILPSIGTGMRYTYMEDTHSNVGFDVAKGRNDWSFNIRFSESF